MASQQIGETQQETVRGRTEEEIAEQDIRQRGEMKGEKSHERRDIRNPIADEYTLQVNGRAIFFCCHSVLVDDFAGEDGEVAAL